MNRTDAYAVTAILIFTWILWGEGWSVEAALKRPDLGLLTSGALVGLIVHWVGCRLGAYFHQHDATDGK